MSPSRLSTAGRALRDARALAAQGNWRALVERVSALERAELRELPELAYLAADAHHRLGALDTALSIVSDVEPLTRANGDHRLGLRVVNLIGVCLFALGRYAEAEECFGELMERASARDDEEFTARASNNLGVLASVRGRRELALTSYERALAAYQRLGHFRGLAQTHHNLGVCYRELGFTDEADSHFLRAIQLGERIQTEDIVGYAETERAMLYARSGDGTLAESLAQRAQERFERLGDAPKRGEVLRVRAAAARARQQDELALQLLGDALAIAERYSNPLLKAEVQRDQGLLLRDRGAAQEARSALLQAADGFAQIGAEAEASLSRSLAAAL